MEQIFSWVLERSLGISVVLLAVMLLQPFLHRRYRPQLNCLVWTALALCLLIPFSLPRTKQAVVTIDWESLIARQEEQMNGSAGTEPEQLSQAEGLPVQSAQRRPVQWRWVGREESILPPANSCCAGAPRWRSRGQSSCSPAASRSWGCRSRCG